MAQKIYLVCEASKVEYKNAAVKNHAKNNKMDCWIESMVLHACKSKEEAIRDCRMYNEVPDYFIHYIQEIILY